LNDPFLRARDACLDNVRQYIKDAKKLMEIESYGHAYALLVVGMEELAKAFAYNAAGTNQILPEPLVQRYIEMHTRNTKDSMTGEAVKAHMIKLQQYSFISDMREVKKAMDKGIPALEAAQTVFSGYADLFKAFMEKDSKDRKKMLEKLTAKEREINRLKMDAFYVEIAGKSVKTPLDPRFKEKAKKLLDELEETAEFVVNTLFGLRI